MSLTAGWSVFFLRSPTSETLRSEEGRFVKGSLTFANPRRPEVALFLRRRAHYPAFTKFGSPEILTVQTLVKLARAIDRWSGSIAVYATRQYEIVAWGVVDQLVQQNVRWHREADGGFENPGLLTITMDGIGDISAYHGDLFLGGLKAQALVTRENNALVSKIVFEYGSDALAPFATAIARVLDDDEREAEILEDLFRMWVTSIARLCIGLRQRGTGGAFLLPRSQSNVCCKSGIHSRTRGCGTPRSFTCWMKSIHRTLNMRSARSPTKRPQCQQTWC